MDGSVKWVPRDASGDDVPTVAEVSDDGLATIPTAGVWSLEYDPTPIMEGGEWTEHGKRVMADDAAEQEQAIARLITSSVAGSRWRDLTPLDVARHLVANGVRVVFEVER